MINKINATLSFFNNKKYLLSFDIARSLASFLVLFMHIEAGFNSYTNNRFINFIHVGSYGVPIFFFISGFLILKSINDKKISNILKFWYRRITRLLPLYYFLLFFYLICILIFSRNLNNIQEINPSKVITSLFFGFGKMEFSYLSASWILWPEFVFYSFTSLLLIKIKGISNQKLLIGTAILALSFLFPGAGLFGTYNFEGTSAILIDMPEASLAGILLTLIGNLLSAIGALIIFQGIIPNIKSDSSQDVYFIKENFLFFLLIILSTYYFAKGEFYFYFASGAFLFLTFKYKKYFYFIVHFLTLLIISMISKSSDSNGLLIYLLFFFTPTLETLATNFNCRTKKIISLLSSISYSVYLTQIFTIPLFFKISYFFWKENLIYSQSIIICMIFTIIISFIIWSNLEKPLNKFFS